MFKLIVCSLLVSFVFSKSAPMKPLSVCCDIPNLGDPKFSGACSAKNGSVLCDAIQCQFEKHGFLINNQTLDKEAYEEHLRQWAKDQVKDKGVNWSDAIDKVVQDCVDKDLRQYSDQPCKAYDVYTCTEIALIKSARYEVEDGASLPRSNWQSCAQTEHSKLFGGSLPGTGSGRCQATTCKTCHNRCPKEAWKC